MVPGSLSALQSEGHEDSNQHKLRKPHPNLDKETVLRGVMEDYLNAEAGIVDPFSCSWVLSPPRYKRGNADAVGFALGGLRQAPWSHSAADPAAGAQRTPTTDEPLFPRLPLERASALSVGLRWSPNEWVPSRSLGRRQPYE